MRQDVRVQKVSGGGRLGELFGDWGRLSSVE